jgi:small subunit ribosomal protein S3Ae
MAKRAAKTKTGLKWKKKKWFSIEAPKAFGGRVIGQSLAETPALLKGRQLVVNLMQLSGNIKKQNLLVGLKVTEILDGVAKTEAIKFDMQTSSVRRLVRKKSSKIEESFCCITKDGIKIRIKPLAVTRNKVSSGVRGAVRRFMVPMIVGEVQKLDFEALIVALTGFDFQKEIKKKLDKVYPLKTFQIKFAGIETAKKAMVIEDATVPTKEVEEAIAEDSKEAAEA